MKYFDVVLFSPPSRMFNHYRPPLALMYLGGYLTHKKVKVKIIDTPMKEQIMDRALTRNLKVEREIIHHKMIEEFKKIKTKIVGITCYTPEYFEVLQLIRDIKKVDSSIRIIVGGVHSTLLPMDYFEEDCGVDICVIGEGEITLYELVQRILNEPERGFSDIRGIVFRDMITKEIKSTLSQPVVDDLNTISFPDYSLVDMNYYTNASPYSIRGCFLKSVYILATRGCPSQCTFCVAKKMRELTSVGKSLRMRSHENIMDEIKMLKETYKIDSFYFIDDLFTINKKKVNQFCNLLKKENLNLLWGCSSKVSTLDEETIKNMHESGCIQIDPGIERGSDKALRIIKKGITIKGVIEFFELCHKYKIRTLANILVNVPEETEDDLHDILKLLDRIKPEVVYFNVFTPFPGTEIYENSSFKLTKKEYLLLAEDMIGLMKKYPEKFKFAKHNIDLKKWIGHNYPKYNRPLRNIVFYLSLRYWKVLIKSRAKMNYIKQFKMLIREFINQRYFALK